MKYFTTVNGQAYEVEINREGEVIVNGEVRHVDFKTMGVNRIYSLLIDNQSFEAVVEDRDGKYQVLMAGDLYEVDVTDERTMRLAQASGTLAGASGEATVRSPMPGTIVAIPITVGQEVTKGMPIVILESMKMQNELKAPRDGVIHHINVKAGDNVDQNQVLVTLH